MTRTIVFCRVIAFVGCSWLVVAAGCSGGAAKDQPDTAPVSGTVLYNGQPVAGATVSFFAAGAPRAASGVTNTEGKFQLSMFGANDGAIPGENTITVSKVESSPVSATPTLSEEDRRDPAKALQAYQQQMGGSGSAPTGPKHLLPEKYSRQDTTTLKETVAKDGTNTFVLQLAD